MKRILQSVFGLLMMLALAVAVLWLVQNAPNSSQAQTTPTPKLARWTTATPIPDGLASAQVVITNAVEVTATSKIASIGAETELPPTTTQIVELNFSTVQVDSVEKVSTGPYKDMVFSPDGTQALFVKQYTSYYLWRGDGTSMRAPLGDIWLLDLSTGAEHQLVQKGGRYTWSPDSTQVAWLASIEDEGIAGALYVMDIAKVETKQVAEADFLGSDYTPQWLPTGELIYVRDGQLWVTLTDDSSAEKALPFTFFNRVAALSGKESYIADRQGVIGYHFSPNGQKIAYLTLNEDEKTMNRQLWVADANGDNPQLITQLADGGYYKWSPDSEWLVFNTYQNIQESTQGNILLGTHWMWVTKNDGNETHLIHQVDNWRSLLAPDWSPNSTMIVFIEEEFLEGDITTRKLWLADIVSHQIKQLPEANPDEAIIRSVWWTPDGRSLYTMQDGDTPGSYQSHQLKLTAR